VSDFDRTRTAIPSFTPRRPEPVLQEEDPDGPFGAEPPLQREGLPPGYRMRHDAHYVDQLTSRHAAPQVRLIAVRDIEGGQTVEPGELVELTASVSRYGVLQPLLVRPRGGRFELIAGARRLAAAMAAGLTEVPCLVHPVDEMRARAMADAENVRPHRPAPAPPATAPDAEGTGAPGAALAELSQSLGAIGSCLHLLAERDRALRDRVALDLIRTEVQRAGRLVRCLDALEREPTLAAGSLPLAPLVAGVLETFAPERRLSGVAMAVATDDVRVHADAEWLSVAIAGALGGTLALVQGARDAEVSVRVAATASRTSAMIEIAQSAVTVPSRALGRLFDARWTDRPGGYPAAVEFAAARRIIELHRGGIEAVPGERGGSRVILLLPGA
jgi:ParB-like chromosome segregation protein Spo0J